MRGSTLSPIHSVEKARSIGPLTTYRKQECVLSCICTHLLICVQKLSVDFLFWCLAFTGTFTNFEIRRPTFGHRLISCIYML